MLANSFKTKVNCIRDAIQMYRNHDKRQEERFYYRAYKNTKARERSTYTLRLFYIEVNNKQYFIISIIIHYSTVARLRQSYFLFRLVCQTCLYMFIYECIELIDLLELILVLHTSLAEPETLASFLI